MVRSEEHGVTVSVPSKSLKVSPEDSKVNLRVRHTKTGKISIQATKTDGTAIKKIPGSKVRIPYPDTGKKAVLKVTNKQGDTVTTAEYHEDQGVAEFEINEPGTYEVQTTGQSKSVYSQGKQMYRWSFYTALAAVAAVITGGTIGGIRRYRKRRE